MNAQEEALEKADQENVEEERRLKYDTFIESLKDEGATADKRCIMHVETQMRELENRMVSCME